MNDTRVAGTTAETPDREGAWVITDDTNAPEARPIASNTPPTDRPMLNRPETASHEHALRGGLPATIRDAAAKEAPGRIVSVEHYVTSDIDVYVVRVNAADGLRELKIRQDGVVLLDTLNPPVLQAGFENNEATPSREIPEIH